MILLTIRTPDTVQCWQIKEEEAIRRMNFLRQFHKNDVDHKYQYEFKSGNVVETLQLPAMSAINDQLRLQSKYPSSYVTPKAKVTAKVRKRP